MKLILTTVASVTIAISANADETFQVLPDAWVSQNYENLHTLVHTQHGTNQYRHWRDAMIARNQLTPITANTVVHVFHNTEGIAFIRGHTFEGGPATLYIPVEDLGVDLGSDDPTPKATSVTPGPAPNPTAVPTATQNPTPAPIAATPTPAPDETPDPYIHIHKAPTPVPTPTPDAAQVARDKAIHRWGGDEKLRVLDVTWQKGGFNTVSMIYLTVKNCSDSPITNISYDSTYTAENGDVVTQGGTHQFFGVKNIKKVVHPGETRTLEINDGFIDSEAYKLNFRVADYESE
jgi:hypothetical protein